MKPGHPAGFIEAFANYYNSIENFIVNNKERENVFGIETAIRGLSFFDSANRRKDDDVRNSDILIIPSENEFHYHIKDKEGKSTYIDPKNLDYDFAQYTEEEVNKEITIVTKTNTIIT